MPFELFLILNLLNSFENSPTLHRKVHSLRGYKGEFCPPSFFGHILVPGIFYEANYVPATQKVWPPLIYAIVLKNYKISELKREKGIILSAKCGFK